MDASPTLYLRATDLPRWRRGLIAQLVARLQLPAPLVREMAAEALQRELRGARWSWIGLGAAVSATVLLQTLAHSGEAALVALFVGLLVSQLVGRIRARGALLRAAGRKARHLAHLRRRATS
ncbi:hypothetical protein EA658_19595 [Pseudoxanthomonas winnipegensis]|jgi:hypothetical protein|uniref:Uncharacterized protein n=1 Tax=Pseudoxanthomonas winnipegensis TaxID=2480810 RepID=A0ABY1W9L8_9GAMM|nr:hypothetical protein [Pseudoxanthomonas winnipegensis]TAA06954.1 hypothetical protein EA659_18990 [Pseudoxanthomonas winnipegensis]TAA16867.1 hypothetical protein EA658_19595 [Pseudoxanthomonas winnipegensis]TAH73505.1 hypothetical protein EA657_07495 [Pseudoxanthomonas winnipegensis]